MLATKGIPEHELFLKLRSKLQTGNTCIIGYNNISFDDHFLRFGMYRNLFPAYDHEHNRGNSRLDFLNIVRLTGALRPDGLTWPMVDGIPTFALGPLAEANNIEIDGAHDALVDVNMTLALARKVKAAQPKLWDYTYRLRKRDLARELLNPNTKQAVLHVSPKYGNTRYCLAPVLPVLQHPEYSNRVFAIDVESNIDLLLSKSADELASMLFEQTETDEPTDPKDRINISLIALNQAPMVATLKALLPENVKRLKLDTQKVESNIGKLRRANDLPNKLLDIFSLRTGIATPQTAEEALYEGLISDRDQAECIRFWKQWKSTHSWITARFEDRRLRDLHTRLKTKVAPDEMSPSEHDSYNRFVRGQLMRTDRSVMDALQATEELLREEPNEEEALVLNELQDHLKSIASQYDL